MEITIKELQQLNENQYQLIDIRSKTEISHGAIPEAVCASAENIEENQEIDFSKKLVICCSRGKVSVEIAENLAKKGYDAVSLTGGHLYSYAKELGCNKIALGHHYDDVIETILMGMLYGAQIQTMMPKLHSTNFEGMELIRPLYLIREEDIKAWRDYNGLHFIQCACKFTDTCTTCNNEENQSKRVEIKELIKELKKTNPFVEGNIFKSVENVNLDTVVAYKSEGVRHTFLDNYDTKA